MARVSVAMCTFNGAQYLREQLDSIAAQVRLPDELIVCDDGSADATRSIVEDFAATASFPVRLYVNERNLGSTKNFERAITLCTGDVIALADQDDVWRSEKLARLEAEFSASPGLGLVFSDAEVVDATLRPMGFRLWAGVGGRSAKRKLRKRNLAFSLLLAGNTVTGATMAFRAELRSLALPIPANIAMIHDGWIALMISAVARVCLIEEPLMLYRQHSAQQIGAKMEEEKKSVLTAMRRVTSYADTLKIIGTVRERLTLNNGPYAEVALRELEKARAHLWMRGHLPEGRLRRLPLVLRELLTLRYHRYGKGISSAAKDLVC